MKLFLKSIVVHCLAVGFVLSLPLPEEVSTTVEAEGTPEGSATGETTAAAVTAETGGSEKNTEAGGNSTPEAEGSGKDDRLNTYNKVNELLDKDTGVNNVENAFLRAILDNSLQSHLRIPLIDAIGRVGDFSKIVECFTSMGADVKKIVDDKVKAFTTCKFGKDFWDNAKCSEDGSSIGSQFDEITSKIKGCVSSKGKAK